MQVRKCSANFHSANAAIAAPAARDGGTDAWRTVLGCLADPVHWWLRDEHKKFEKRAPMTPAQVAVLLSDGHQVTVERSNTRVFTDAEYEATGCQMAPSHSWPDAPKNAVIFALKELPDDGSPLKHAHVMFGHCYKGQSGARSLLSRFAAGGGMLYDLEFLHVPKTDVRIAAFGHMTGYAGAGLGVLVWAQQMLHPTVPLRDVDPFPSEAALLRVLRENIAAVGRMPSAHIIGASGRCGSGSVRLFTELGVKDVVLWDRKETAAGGPFPGAFKRDLFLNTIYLSGPMAPFVTPAMLADPAVVQTRVIVDISCDHTSKNNPLPIYTRGTDFDEPALRLVADAGARRYVDLIAVDHLPAMLPRESSIRYAEDVFPYVRAFGIRRHALETTWSRAADLFQRKKAEVLGQ